MNKNARSVNSLKMPTDDMRLKASTPYRVTVDPREVISLDFGKAHAVVDTWEHSYVLVTPNVYFNRYVELLNEQNLILFDYESYVEENLFISERAGFVVRIPSCAALTIIAGQSFIRDCTIHTVQSDSLELKDCTLLDNFMATGDYVSVQNSTIGKHASFNVKINVLRHCTCSTLMLNGNRKYNDMSVELRNVRGKGVWLGSQQVRRIDARFHHVRLNRFVLEAGVEQGSVLLEGTKITRIENYSAIPIMKSMLGYHQICA